MKHRIIPMFRGLHRLTLRLPAGVSIALLRRYTANQYLINLQSGLRRVAATWQVSPLSCCPLCQTTFSNAVP
jgi:hypothetical protein